MLNNTQYMQGLYRWIPCWRTKRTLNGRWMLSDDGTNTVCAASHRVYHHPPYFGHNPFSYSCNQWQTCWESAGKQCPLSHIHTCSARRGKSLWYVSSSVVSVSSQYTYLHKLYLSMFAWSETGKEGPRLIALPISYSAAHAQLVGTCEDTQFTHKRYVHYARGWKMYSCACVN